MWLASIAVAFAEVPPPLPPDARFALALYCNPTCTDEVFDTLDSALSAIKAKNGFPETATKPLRVMGLAGTEFGVPDADFIAEYGVGVDRPDALPKSEQVILAWFAGPRDKAIETLEIAHGAFAAAAEKSGGWVEDLDTQRIYGVAAWRALNPAGPLIDWFVVDGDPQDPNAPDGDVRLVTRGLRRFGDFELVVESVAPDATGDVSFVVNELAQAIHGKEGVASRMPVKTKAVDGVANFAGIQPREGDPEAPLLRARFEGDVTFPAVAEAPEAEPVPEAPAAEPMTPVAQVDVAPPPLPPEPVAPPSPVAPIGESSGPPTSLDEARTRALERLQQVVRPAWNAGLPTGAAVAVNAPFPTKAGGQEFMWVELRSWTDTDMTGVLMNEPFDVYGLRKGDMVSLKPSDVFDYVWKRGDGSREGNTTAKFVNR